MPHKRYGNELNTVIVDALNLRDALLLLLVRKRCQGDTIILTMCTVAHILRILLIVSEKPSNLFEGNVNEKQLDVVREQNVGYMSGVPHGRKYTE